jgi:hypothetical protein
MTLQRRSSALRAHAWLLGLALGAASAAATVACGPPDGGGLLGQSGGSPLGAPVATAPASTGDGTSTPPVDDAGSDLSDTGATPGPDADAAGSIEGGDADDGVAAPAPDGGVDAAPEAGPASMNFTLLDTTVTTVVAGSPVSGYDPIVEGATINLTVTGTALSLRANTGNAVVGSVGFALDATYTHTEETAPYTLCGDDGAGTITSCATVLTAGKHTLTATPYSAAMLGGTAGTPVTLDFTLAATDAGADAGSAAAAKDATVD